MVASPHRLNRANVPRFGSRARRRHPDRRNPRCRAAKMPSTERRPARSRRRPWGALALVPLVAAMADAAASEKAAVRFEHHAEAKHVDVLIGGKSFVVYNYGTKYRKPFFYPVRAADGTILTRPILRPGDDHPHHKGLWIAVDEVNGIDFWAEKGAIVNRSVRTHAANDHGPARLEVVNSWQSLEGEPVLEEHTTFSFFPDRMIVLDIRLQAVAPSVAFDDTKEGFAGFRMVNWMREREGGQVVNAEGLRGTRACWGKPSKWVDYFGPAGGKTHGVTWFDHPRNFRPSRYHVRDYGLFAISPFGPRAYSGGAAPASPVKLKRGEKLRIRYGFYVHDGDTTQGRVAEAYRRFLQRGGE